MGSHKDGKSKKSGKHKRSSKEKKGKKEKRRHRSKSPSSSSSDSDDGRVGVNKQLRMGRAAARATREILAYNHDLRKELREVRGGGGGWRRQRVASPAGIPRSPQRCPDPARPPPQTPAPAAGAPAGRRRRPGRERHPRRLPALPPARAL